MRKLLLFLFFAFISSYCVGQIKLDSISRVQIEKRIKQKVGMVSEYFSTIAQRNSNIHSSLHFVDKCLSLFIGKGGPYKEDGVERKGVVIEISSKKRNTNRKLLLKNYLYGLANQRYRLVKIKNIEIAEIDYDSLVKISDNEYIGKAYISNQYIGERDGTPIYRDTTRREISITINVEEVLGGGIDYFASMLGNIFAVEE